MADNTTHKTGYVNGTGPGATDEVLVLDSKLLLERFQRLQAAESLDTVRGMVAELCGELHAAGGSLRGGDNGALTTNLRLAHLLREMEQITRARTLERARYYIRRLVRSLTEVRTSAINDINLNRWKEYEEIYTESLWLVDRRDRSGVHMADYWGNFIPQIPHQMMRRYTRQGEWVLDTFAGLGTTLIEGQRLGRHTLGVELQPEIAHKARQRVNAEPNGHSVTCEVVTGDSTMVDYPALLERHEQRSVQLVIMHPPYHDIIKFSDDPADLSNAPSISDFLDRMGRAVDNAVGVLDRGRYLALVIGDKYAAGEWIPLGFQTMQQVQQRGFTLKSIIVKNFEEGRTAGKRYQKALWRYRALAGGFYIFKHEYIFLFQKS